ncbi:MAG: PQQ-dependent dehydrogenase, methanol/ethanol family [Salinisphaeraceae bacterium]|nr:PQQ-dependent dehydrogenase, methanol/ethanol family [Salinisphaeraceae bacterium]
MRHAITLAALAFALVGCDGATTTASQGGKDAAKASTAATQAPAKKPFADVDGARIKAADKTPGDWVSHGRTYSEQRYSPLDTIDTGNVGKLGLAWHYKLDWDRATETTPVVADGLMIVTGAYSIVSALDPVTGKEVWKYDPEVPKAYARNGCCDVANRGVAVWQGKVYVGSYDGRLIALDAQSGDEVWEVDTVVDRDLSYTVTGAPRIINGKVIIGNGGAELGVRGYVTAYDAESGDQVWRFYTVPGNPTDPVESEAMKMAMKTWSGDQWWKFGGGGTAWDAMAYDPELNLLYIGVGNGSPWNRHVRSPGGGDNLFLSSIVALDPDTGKYKWHYQTTPADNWDYTATQSIILADLSIDGKQRKVLMQAPKNGFFYVIDRKTGELLSAEKFAPANWASHVDMETGRPVENPEADWKDKPAMVSPGAIGAHNWQPMSYNPQTGLVYIPQQEAVAYYEPDLDEDFSGKGNWHMGSQPIALPENQEELSGFQGMYKGNLLAWDPVKQEEAWRQPFDTIWNGGTLSTAGELVFQGTADGRFVAYNAKTGEKLWEHRANSGVMAGPMTYTIDGEQYVTVAAGWGGAWPLALGGLSEPAKVEPEARILTFKLGGKAELPPPQNRTVALPELPEVTADEATIAEGRQMYNAACGTCHGPNVQSGSVVPDLRYMTPEEHDQFAAIVAGARSQQGMPAFMDRFTPEQVTAIHQYVIKRAHDLKAQIESAPSQQAANRSDG